MRLLRDAGALSRADLARRSGLAKATVGTIVGQLQQAGAVAEGASESTGRGPSRARRSCSRASRWPALGRRGQRRLRRDHGRRPGRPRALLRGAAGGRRRPAAGRRARAGARRGSPPRGGREHPARAHRRRPRADRPRRAAGWSRRPTSAGVDVDLAGALSRRARRPRPRGGRQRRQLRRAGREPARRRGRRQRLRLPHRHRRPRRRHRQRRSGASAGRAAWPARSATCASATTGTRAPAAAPAAGRPWSGCAPWCRATGIPVEPGEDPVAYAERIARAPGTAAAIAEIGASLARGVAQLAATLDPAMIVLGGSFVPLGRGARACGRGGAGPRLHRSAAARSR